MSSIAIMQSKLDALQQGGMELPGLDFETIVRALVKIKFPHLITKEEIEATIKSYAETAKSMINGHIANIKSAVAGLQKGIVTITKTVPTVVAGIAAAIATSLAGIPNPGIALAGAMDAMQKKNILMTIVDLLTDLCIKLLSSAIAIGFIIPGAVLILIDSVNIVKTLVKSIPG